MIMRMDFASTVLPLALIWTLDLNFVAVWTKTDAGRAWMPVLFSIVTVASVMFSTSFFLAGGHAGEALIKSAHPSYGIFSVLSSSANPRRSFATPAVCLLDRNRKSTAIWATIFYHRFLIKIAAPAAQKFCSALSILHTACQLSRCWDFFITVPSKPVKAGLSGSRCQRNSSQMRVLRQDSGKFYHRDNDGR